MGGDRRRSSFRRRDLRGHAVCIERVTASGCGGSGSTIEAQSNQTPGHAEVRAFGPTDAYALWGQMEE